MKKKMIAALLLLTILLLLAFSASADVLDGWFLARLSRSKAIYSGPGKHYYRANNAKATYGSPGEAHIFGLEANGWLLIGYELSNGDYRVGYCEPGSAAEIYDRQGDYALMQLSFAQTSAVINQPCYLTDDPCLHMEPVSLMAQGTGCVFLSTLDGAWAYIEVAAAEGLMRGFVPVQCLTVDGSPLQLGPSYGFSRPVIEVREVWARAKQKLATRALPTTRSEDTGTYFLAEQQVLVLAKHWDSVNGIWWVKCAIETNKGTRHLWTGAKRFYPETLPLEKLPEE